MISIIAWVIFIKGIIGLGCNITTILTANKVKERSLYFFIGIPLTALNIYLAYYFLFMR